LKNKKIVISDHIIDPSANSLSKNGSNPRRVEPKLMELLVYFCEHKDEVLTRDQLGQAIWPGTVVGNEALNKAIFGLRALLADDAQNPRYIETIPKRGYRWIAPVSYTKSRPRRISVAIIALVSLLIAAALLWALQFGAQEQTDFSVKNIEQIVSRSGVEGGYRLNPSGTAALYIHRQQDKIELVTYSLPDGAHKTVSPAGWESAVANWIDDETILYRRCQNTACEIIRWSNESEQNLHKSKSYIPSMSAVHTATSSVYFTAVQGPQDVSLHSLSLLTGKVDNLSERFAEIPKVLGYLSIDEANNQLYFVDYQTDKKPILAMNLSNGLVNAISQDFSQISNMIVDGDHLLVSGERENKRGIYSVNLNSKDTQAILLNSNDQNLIISSKKGNSIYFESSNHRRQSWVLEIGAEAQKFTAHPNDEQYNLRYGNSTKEIFFASTRNGYHNLWRYSLETQKSEQLSEFQSWYLSAPIVSHDNTLLAVYVDSTEPQLVIIDLHKNTVSERHLVPNGVRPLAWEDDNRGVSLITAEGRLANFSLDSSSLDTTDINIIDMSKSDFGVGYYLFDDSRAQVDINGSRYDHDLSEEGRVTQIFASNEGLYYRTLDPSAIYFRRLNTEGRLEPGTLITELPTGAKINDVADNRIILELPQKMQGDTFKAVIE
jgi:DNA-binding winged helix-turn-helix (wHTH) protein